VSELDAKAWLAASQQLLERERGLELDGAPEAVVAALDEIAAEHVKLADAARALATQRRGAQVALLERQRLAELHAPNPPATATHVQLALLRGDSAAASRALRDRSPRAAETVLRGDAAALDGYEALCADPALADVRGPLLVRLGRIYRDEVRSMHLAQRAFAAAAALLPGEPEPLVERAECDRRAGRADAMERFLAATRMAPQRAGGWIGAALVAEANGLPIASEYAQQAAQILVGEADPLAALHAIQPAVSPSVLLAIGVVATPARFDVARAALDELVALAPANPPSALGRAYQVRAALTGDAADLFEAGRRALWSGDPRMAAELLQAALAAKPDDAVTEIYLADTYRLLAPNARDDAERRGLLATALAHSIAGFAHRPPLDVLDWASVARAEVLMTLSEIDGDVAKRWDAVAAGEQAALLAPDNAEFLASLAEHHRKAGNPIASREVADRALALAPDSGRVAEILLPFYVNNGNFARALALVERVPDTSWRRAVFGYLLVQHSTTPDALARAEAQLESALAEVNPQTRGWVSTTLGICFLLQGQQARATACFADSREYGITLIEKLEGAVFGEDFAAALALAAPALAAADPSLDILGMAALAHLASGKLDEARALFGKLTERLRGDSATNWLGTIGRDLACTKTFQTLPPDAAAVRDDVLAALRTCAALEERRSVERELADALDRVPAVARDSATAALALARVRRARGGSATAVREAIEALPAALAATSAAAAAVAWAASATTDDELVAWALRYSKDVIPHLPALTTTVAIAAKWLAYPPLFLFTPLRDRVGELLGLAAPAPSPVRPIELLVPDAVVSDGGTPEASALVTRVIPSARRDIDAQRGLELPGVRVVGQATGAFAEVRVAGAQVGSQLFLRSAQPPDVAGEEFQAWLVAQLVPNLSTVTGVAEVVALLDRSGPLPDGIANRARLWQLTRVVRALLRGGISLRPLARIVEAIGDGSRSDEAVIERVCAAETQKRALPERIRARVPAAVEAAVAERVVDGALPYFAIAYVDVGPLVASLAAAAPPPGAGLREAPVYVTRHSALRPWLRALLAGVPHNGIAADAELT
jgi:tetratricopeptide (TPR) repeat protein